MKYFDELKRSMEWLGEKKSTYFIGQAVEVPGTAMFNTLKDIDPKKRLELPVFEDTQMGMSIGMALTAAETGHLVFGTLHTTSAAKTIDRVIDVFPAEEKDMVRAMLSESLQAVISQTLLKKNVS